MIPDSIDSKSVLYEVGDEIKFIYMIQHGSLAFVDPRCDNKCFAKDREGEIIGLEDYISE